MLREMRENMLNGLPLKAQNKIHSTLDNIGVMMSLQNPRVAAALAPSAVRGLVMNHGQRGEAVAMKASHSAHYTLTYGGEFPEMYELYRRAVANQWNGDSDLPWATSVDHDNPNTPILRRDFVPFDLLQSFGVRLTPAEERRFTWDMGGWMLSQFMHGEQGALYAAAQVTESVHWLDGKLYGATQVMDEGRHLEVFLRYLDTKVEKIYAVNDNLFVIIDDLMTDSRWDIKFLGMQIMVEGLALGAFSTMYANTGEPLLKQLLKYVIQDEARHVHYGVLALREHFSRHITDAERREREDWAFEIALLMRNRFKMHEVYHEWFAHKVSLRDWDRGALESPTMAKFRNIMFQRLIPNLEYIGLMSERIKGHYEKSGLTSFLGGKNATQLSAEELTAENDRDAMQAALMH